MSLDTVNAPPRVCMMRTGIPAGSVCRWPLGTAIASQSRLSSILSAAKFAMTCYSDLLLGRDRLVVVVQGRLQRVPCQRGALHARGKLGNTGKHLQLAHIGAALPLLACHHAVEALEHLFGLLQALAFEGLGHHGGRGLGDGAAVTLERNVL